MIKVLGILIFLMIGVVGPLWYLGLLYYVVDFMTLAVVLVATAGLSLVYYRKGDTIKSFLGYMKRNVLLCGNIRIFVYLFSVLANADDPSRLGPQIIVAFSPFFYGLILYGIFGALENA